MKSGYSYFNATVGLLMLLTMSGNFQAGRRSDPRMRSGFVASFVSGRRVVGCKSSGGDSPAADGGDWRRQLSGADDLISDFENDNSLGAVDGRQGGWYTYGDDPDVRASERIQHRVEGNPNCRAVGALHVKGTGFASGGRHGVD